MKQLCIAVIILPSLILNPAFGQDNADRSGQDNSRKRKPAPSTLPTEVRQFENQSIILGRPTDKSITVNVLSAEAGDAFVEYGQSPENYSNKTDIVKMPAGIPVEIQLDKLERDKAYFGRLQTRRSSDKDFSPGRELSFHTQRAPGSAFTFEIQGDSHPERPQMFDPSLYAQVLRSAAADKPDFYMTIGDDFSVDTLRTITADSVRRIYLDQRYFLSVVGQCAPLFLVNGNHEQAALCNLDGTADNVAVWAQKNRNSLFSQPAPDDFYSGDAKPVEHIGLLRDYYAWTWGDALFVVIDPYWHSSSPVDNVLGGGPKRRDLWEITLGDEQYKWLKKVLESSSSKFKFVFTHHVLGTGRGGIEEAGLFEWGGKNKKGENEFSSKRPGWDLPIHQLMVKNHVTILFQCHDHIFVRQQLDGIVYQTLPLPADPGYAWYNKDAFETGDALPGSGRVRVSVGPEKVRVEYIRSYLPKDVTKEHPDGEVAYNYEIPASGPASATAPASRESISSVVAQGAKAIELAKNLQFTEGPAADKDGNVFFSDVHASRTYKWSTDGKITLFRENTGGVNGLAFDADGNLIACEGAGGRIVSVDAKGQVTVVADKYDGKRFNQPNDLWIDPKGGVYFSDPIYGKAEKFQNGEHVYYISPDRKKIIRVIDDMVRPNGLAGTPDGKILYVADHGAGKTFRYSICEDGTLKDKTLFVSNGSDGMKLDFEGNVYITTDAVLVFDPSGKQIARIEVPLQPTNLCFAGKDDKTLFITARAGVYSINMNVCGAGGPPQQAASSQPGNK